jgi:hypothetical protein
MGSNRFLSAQGSVGLEGSFRPTEVDYSPETTRPLVREVLHHQGPHTVGEVTGILAAPVLGGYRDVQKQRGGALEIKNPGPLADGPGGMDPSKGPLRLVNGTRAGGA